MIRPPPSTTMSTTLKAKRRCCTSFFITDILGNQSRSPSPTSNHNKTHLTSNFIKNTENGDYDDDDDDNNTMLRDSDDNGKKKIGFLDLSKSLTISIMILFDLEEEEDE